MKRFAISLSFAIVLAGVCSVADSQSNADPARGADHRNPECQFSLTGLWRTDATSRDNPLYFDFSPEGWVVLLGYSADALPQDFETIGSAQYKLDKPAKPTAIEFTARRGNDVFVQGVTVLKILERGDDSFTTRNAATGEERKWIREQTHKYFLALVARSGIPAGSGPAFVMWIKMDGRDTKIDALGVRLTKDAEGKSVPVFGPIPSEVYEQIKEQSEEEKKTAREEILIMRFELTGRDFEKTHQVFDKWDKLANSRTLPSGDPYVNALELILEAAGSMPPCGENLKLTRLNRNEADDIAAKASPPQRLIGFIRVFRTKNIELHVPDRAFPWGWRPMIQLPAQ